MAPRAWLLAALQLLLLLAAGRSGEGVGTGTPSSSARSSFRAPPSATSSALWPETASGKPLPRAKPIVSPADATWGSIWLPCVAPPGPRHSGRRCLASPLARIRPGRRCLALTPHCPRRRLDAVFDLDALEHTDMKMRFNGQYPAKVGRRVQAGDLTELQHRWKAYKSVISDAEEAAMEQQADRTGEISELDSEDGTVKVQLDATVRAGKKAERPADAAAEGASGADEAPAREEDATWLPLAALAGSPHAVGARVAVHPYALLVKAWAAYDSWEEDYAWQAEQAGRITELDLSDGTALVSFSDR